MGGETYICDKAANREKLAAYQRAYRAANREKLAAQRRAYREKKKQKMM